jgi:hypothetical protein
MLSPEDQATIKQWEKGEMVGRCHFSLGLWIRNNFGLWGGNSDLMASCAGGKPRGYMDPDTASGIILEALWDRLHAASGEQTPQE